MKRSLTRLIDSAACGVFLYLMKDGAVGGYEDHYGYFGALTLLLLIGIFSISRAADLRFRIVVYPLAAAFGFLLLWVDMSRVYGGVANTEPFVVSGTVWALIYFAIALTAIVIFEKLAASGSLRKRLFRIPETRKVSREEYRDRMRGER